MEQDVDIGTVVDKKPDYGLDSPRVLKLSGYGGIAALTLGLVLRPSGDLGMFLTGPVMSLKMLGAFSLIRAALMARYSMVAKFEERDRLVNSIAWRGDEQVLDVGCGRGLMMNAIAKKLTTGKVTGIDIWNSKTVSDNWAEGTWENARLEGVEDRVDVRDGDMREMPFQAGTFDVVVTCNVLYHVDTLPQCRKVTNEMFRVLKPGGQAHLIEPGLSSGLIQALRGSGFEKITKSGIRWGLFPPGRALSARKPLTSYDGVEEQLRQLTQELGLGDNTQDE